MKLYHWGEMGKKLVFYGRQRDRPNAERCQLPGQCAVTEEPSMEMLVAR